MNTKQIKKILRISVIVLLVMLIIEFATVALIISNQPSRRDVVIAITEKYKQTNGFGYGAPDLGSTFYGISTFSMLGKTLTAGEVSAMESFILGKLDKTTGLFLDASGQPSLKSTYYAIGALNKISNITSVLNSSQIQGAVLSLQTANGLFRDFDETDEIDLVYGELDHMFQAISILEKLATNTTEFYLSINRTKIAESISTLQASDGSISSGNFENEYTMKNAYHVSSIIHKLNVSVEFFDGYGFHSSALVKWIQSMYEDEGFRMTPYSQPTPEATAYALITLSRMGYSTSNLTSLYSRAIDEMVSETIEELDRSDDPIDVIHDVVLALLKSGNLGKLNEKYVSKELENSAGVVLAITSILFVLAFAASSMNTLKEGDLSYFDSSLSRLVPQILEDVEGSIEKLSELLGLTVEKVVLIEHQDPSIGTLRALTGKYEVLLTFQYETWDVRSLQMLPIGSTEVLLDVDFYESKLISDIKQMIHESIELTDK